MISEIIAVTANQPSPLAISAQGELAGPMAGRWADKSSGSRRALTDGARPPRTAAAGELTTALLSRPASTGVTSTGVSANDFSATRAHKPPAGNRFYVLPRLTYAVPQAGVSANVRQLLSVVAAIVNSKALQGGLQVVSMTVEPSNDIEEFASTVVLDVHVDALEAQALALWDAIGRALDDWQEVLPTESSRRLAEALSVSIRWPLDE